MDLFINYGYGWLCRQCDEQKETRATKDDGRARFMSEGEAEAKEVVFSTPALARWRDASRKTLFCPRCGSEEVVDKS